MEFLFLNVQRALERVHALFLVKRDREQDRFHGIVVALVSGRLRVAARAMKQPVEKRLVLAPQRAPEFRPVQRGVLNQLNKCRNRASHRVSPFSFVRA
jgi:hypothetical protein